MWQWRGDDERIVKFANALNKEKNNSIDYFIFGHFHYPLRETLKEGGELLLLGEWINNCDCFVYDGVAVERKIIK